MRVLLVIYEFPPLGGGAGVATRELALALGRSGVRLDIVTAAPERELTDHADHRVGPRGIVVNRVAPGVVAYRLRIRRPGIHQASMTTGGRFVVRAAGLVRHLVARRRYDVVHLVFSLPTGALLPIVRAAGVPTLVALRGSDVPGYNPWNRRLQLAHRVLRPVTRWIWRNADVVVALSTSLADLARQTEPTLQPLVIGNGVDTDLFRPAADGRGDRGDLRCLSVCRLVKRKSVDTVLHAMHQLRSPTCRLTIVGSGPEEERLRTLARSLGLDDVVHFAGAIAHDQLPALYAENDLFVLAPLSESFGNVFAEALASGLPIVASRVGGILDLVTSGTNGILVAPRDPEALSEAIRTLARDPGLRQAMARRNRDDAVATLSWDRVAGGYLSAYCTAAPTGAETPGTRRA